MSSISGRLGRLEHIIDSARSDRCLTCGYPDHATDMVLTCGDSELPKCFACSRPLDPNSRRPVTNEFKHIQLMLDDE